MEQSAGVGQPDQQVGKEAGFDVALANKGVPDAARVGHERLGLGALLGGAFHDLHTVQGFGEVRIHFAEGLPDFVGDGRHRSQITPQGIEIADGKQGGREQQRGMIAGHDEERDDDEEGRADDQVNARAEHQVDLAHVVRSTRHGIANRLEVVEGHALAQQGDVELVADVALEALGRQLRAEVAAKLKHAAHDLGAAQDESQRNEGAQVTVGLEHVIKSIADQHGDEGRQGGVADGPEHQHDQDGPIAGGVRPDPAFRALGAFGRLTDECEFGGGGEGGHGIKSLPQIVRQAGWERLMGKLYHAGRHQTSDIRLQTSDFRHQILD